MRKILLITLMSIVSIISKAQSIQNSTWACYSPTDVFFRYYYFSTDTVYFATDTASFTSFATFSESGNNVTFQDFSGQCVGVPGNYTYLIQNDTLRFTIVNDPCTLRSNIFGSYYLVNLLSGINTFNLLQTSEVFPNPSKDGIFNVSLDNNSKNNTKITVINSLGKEVFSKNVTDYSDKQKVNIQELSAGIYFLILQNGQSKKVYRIIR